MLSSSVTGSLLQMNNPSNGFSVGGGTLLFGGSEFTVVLTFQLPVLTVQLNPGLNSFAQLFTATSGGGGGGGGIGGGGGGGAQLSFGLAAYFTGANSGNVSVSSFSYSSTVNGVVTTIFLATPPMVAMPMLVGGWVSVAFSVNGAGVATLSVRDIFTTNNATSGACACFVEPYARLLCAPVEEVPLPAPLPAQH